MFDPNFYRTSTERTGDNNRPWAFNHSKEHKGRVQAHIDRVHRETHIGCPCDICVGFQKND